MDLTLPGFVRRRLRIGVVRLSVKGQLKIVVKFEIKKRLSGVFMSRGKEMQLNPANVLLASLGSLNV